VREGIARLTLVLDAVMATGPLASSIESFVALRFAQALGGASGMVVRARPSDGSRLPERARCRRWFACAALSFLSYLLFIRKRP